MILRYYTSLFSIICNHFGNLFNQVHITIFADTGVIHNLVENLCHGHFIIGYVLCESFQTTTNFLFGQCHVQNHSVFEL